jgi:hypothetical protein
MRIRICGDGSINVTAFVGKGKARDEASLVRSLARLASARQQRQASELVLLLVAHAQSFGLVKAVHKRH